MPQINTAEEQFETDIESALISKGYISIPPSAYDLDKNLFFDVLLGFLKDSQPNEWARYERKYGPIAPEKLYRRLEDEIANKGLIDVLKNGIKDIGIALKFCFFKPESGLNERSIALYKKNVFGVTRQFRYSKSNNKEVDIVLSINGIPLIAFELKDPLKGQTYENAIEQWKNDRDHREPAFQLNHRILGYFAVDFYEVWMTSELRGPKTRFVPFNQGSEGPGNPGGKGNPVTSEGYVTSYLWDTVFEKDSFLELVQKFLAVVEEKEEEESRDGSTRIVTRKKLIFPRYHQYDAVRKLIADVRENGSGKNYLVNHSAGSGKSNSIAWLAYRLASVFGEDEKPIFDSVIVVTNRIVLDTQLQDTINSFDHAAGLVEAITSRKGSKGLKDAINDRKRIIICTIQKFLYAYKEFDSLSGRNFAIVIDEAHQGQSGESARTLRGSLIDRGREIESYREEEGLTAEEIDEGDELLDEIIAQGHHDNQSFFAFTATPNSKALELFGTETAAPVGQNSPDDHTPRTIKKAFHTYSMRQAIEEGFILDVLANYRTIKQAFKLIKDSEDDPELIESQTSKALYAYYKGHTNTIESKVAIIMENFLMNCRHKINGHGKAMVVTSSRHNAVRYYHAIKEYINSHPEQCAGVGVLVAFSGEVKFDGDPKTYTEAGMNVGSDGHQINSDKKFRKAFRSDDFNIMVVANKYQTGYDEPLLHSMYVDKKLRGVNAVQTLSRLNRTYPCKTDTFVLDFENSAEEIKSSFQPFYEEVNLLGTTNVNYVYDLLTKLKSFSLFSDSDVDSFNTAMSSSGGPKGSARGLGVVTSILKPVADAYNDLNEEDRLKFRDTALKFTRAYGFVTQLVRIADKDLFKDYLFISHLIRVLPKTKVDTIDITDKIKLEYASLTETYQGAISLEKKGGEVAPSGFKPKTVRAKKLDALSRIIDRVNDKYGDSFSEADRVALDSVYNMMMSNKDVLNNLKKYAKGGTSPDMFIKSIFPDKFHEILIECFTRNDQAFDKLLNNTEFQNSVMDIMAKEFYRALKKEDENK